MSATEASEKGESFQKEIASYEIERSLLSDAYFQLKGTTKKLEEKNRFLRILSSINQVLIHATDEAQLLSEACRIMGEIGGYRMLWIGFKEDDAAKTVHPVAHAGFESGYLEAAHITWADTEYGRGPIGVALRTAETQIVPDISKEPLMAPWHKLALERGYKSIIVLPLRDGDKAFGALSIYTDRVDAFSEDEVGILEESANDLAFGIVTLRAGTEREVLEEELLKASTDRYKALFVSSRDAIMTLEPPGWKFTSGNPATVKMFGVKSEGDFLVHEPWTLSPKLQPDGRSSMEKAKEMIEKAMREGSNFFEWMHQRVNGETFPTEVLLSRVEQDGKAYLHALVRDITERKRLEERLKEYAEERFKVIFDGTNDGMVLADATTHQFSLGNAAFSRMLGYTPEEVRMLRIENIHPAEDLPYVLEQFDKQIRGEISVAKDIRVKRKDGSVFYADINSSSITVSGREYILGVFRDITERKEIETTLQQNEERLRLEVARMPIGYIVWDKDFRVVTWNPAAEHIFGFTFDEARGRHPYEIIVPPEAQPQVDEIWGRLLTGDISANSVNKNTTKDGRTIICDWVNTPLKQPDGTIIGVISMVQDVTAREEAEQKEREYVKGVEDMNKLMVGRELKMIELKTEIEELKQKIPSQ